MKILARIEVSKQLEMACFIVTDSQQLALAFRQRRQTEAVPLKVVIRYLTPPSNILMGLKLLRMRMNYNTVELGTIYYCLGNETPLIMMACNVRRLAMAGTSSSIAVMPAFSSHN